MKAFQFKRVKWDASGEDYKFIKHITTLELQTSRWKSIGEAISFVEEQYQCDIVSCHVKVADMEVYD